MGKYDAAGKHLITLYHQAWAEWVLQAEQIQVAEELSGEFRFFSRHTDSLLKVVGMSGEFLSLTELQFVYDPKMPLRLAAYKLLARQKYELPVYVTVIYFLPPPADETVATAYEERFRGQTVLVDYQVIKIWELEAEAVLRYNNPMLLPFVPLMQGGGTEQMVWRCVERIRQEPEPAASELEMILAVFAGYIFDVTMIRQMLRWNMHVILDSPLFQEMKPIWMAQAREEGRQEGREEGRQEGRKAMIKSLKLILTNRFEVTSDEFDDPLAKLTWESLQELTEIALKADNLAEFRAQLIEKLPPDETPADL